MTRPTPRPDEFTTADDAIARHREELKKRFPLPSPSKKPRRPGPATLGASIAVLGLAGGLFWLDPAYKTEQFSSAAGQRQLIELADGSRMTLDSSSRVAVSWHLRTRQVELQAGQALFDVAPARYRPFHTLAGATRIIVVGTRYNVSRVQEDVRVTVEQGKVSVLGRDAGLMLLPGDQVLVHDGQLGRRSQVDASAVAAWAEGRLVFDRTPLREVLDVIRRYRQISIRLDDDSLAQLPVSGTFDSARLDRMLALLPKILPVNVAADADGGLLVTRKTPRK
ncbi:FecR protein [compost metagenome]